MAAFVGRSPGHEKQTVTSAAAVSLGSIPAESAVPQGCFLIGIVSTTEPIRCLFDGSDPTATEGYLMQAERDLSEYLVEGRDNLAALDMIAVSTTAIVNIVYMVETYRRGEP